MTAASDVRFGDTLFVCVVCKRDVHRWGDSLHGPSRQIAPVCRYCESEWGRGIRAPAAGAFADRRKVMQIAVLAECLSATAHRQLDEGRW